MNQNRTTIGNLDYCIATLQNLKKTLCNYGNPHHTITWDIGAIFTHLNSNLLRIMHDVILNPEKTDPPNSVQDLAEIMKRFDEFMVRTIELNAKTD